MVITSDFDELKILITQVRILVRPESIFFKLDKNLIMHSVDFVTSKLHIFKIAKWQEIDI